MARRLRLYSHPLVGRIHRGGDERVVADVAKDASRNTESFIKYIPRNISPISHVIIPQTSGLDPNAHLTPLKGYQIRFKGKMMERTLKSNIFKFRTGHTRRADYRSHHYEEGYSVHGPFGSVGVKVYYEYELDPYFASNEIYSEINQESIDKNAQQSKEDNKFKYKVSDYSDTKEFDRLENERTEQLLIQCDDDL
eukprot:338111_1